MPKLTDTRQTKIVKLKTVEGGEAVVYTSLLAGDVDKLNREGALDQQKPHIIKIAMHCVKEWNLTDENDKPLELNEKNLARLYVSDLNEIVNEGLSDFLPPQAEGQSGQKRTSAE